MPVDDLNAYFGPQGTLARDGGAFAFRPQQLAYAEAVQTIIRKNGLGMVEGGTGVGKTLGYLVPHILDAQRTGKRVLIATKTRNLQDQIFHHDLPRLARSLKISFALLKGRENYLCDERLAEAEDDPRLFVLLPAQRALTYLRRFNRVHATGDLEATETFLRRYGEDGRRALAAARATDDVCISTHRGACRYYKALAAAEKAQVIVANHHLALLWPDTYPEVARVVIDEAHALEEAATDIYSDAFSPGALRSRLRRLRNRRRPKASLLGRFSRRDQAEFKLELVAEAADVVEGALARYEEAAAVWCEGGKPGRRRLVDADRGTTGWQRLGLAAEGLGAALDRLATELSRAVRDLKEGESFGPSVESLSRQMLSYVEVRAVLGRLFAPLDPATVLWQEVTRRGLWIWRSPIAVGPSLREHLYNCFQSVLLTSATLQAGGDFAFLAERLGLAERNAADELEAVNERVQAPVAVGHPFDYRSNVLLCLHKDAAETGKNVEAIADRLSTLARLSGGRMLALFTNKERMRRAAELIDTPGLAVLAQGRDGGRHDLTRALKRRAATLLLGVRSFWEGIDVPGPNLSIVVMEKIPFTSPGEPVYDARCEALGEKWFVVYALPLALLTLRQGFGRLIRTETDRGVVVILDPGKKSYARRLRATLPDCATVEGGMAEIAAAVEEFFGREARGMIED